MKKDPYSIYIVKKNECQVKEISQYYVLANTNPGKFVTRLDKIRFAVEINIHKQKISMFKLKVEGSC